MKKSMLTFGRDTLNTAAEARAWAKDPASRIKLPKAQWSDDRLVWACQGLAGAAVTVLRELEDGQAETLAQACGEAIVCATCCASHFTYSDESSLAERIGACNELAQCCQALIAALDGQSGDGLTDLRAAAETCLAQCRSTAGTEEEEEDGPAHPEPAPAPAPATNTVATAKADQPKPKGRAGWLKVKASDDNYVHMSISGYIGADLLDDSGTCADEFLAELKAIPDDKDIHVHIDSEGGSLPDGMAIYNALKARRPHVTSHVDGVALSCASVIALAGEKVISPVASVWMIHKARISTYGDDEEHKKAIKMLATFTSAMADVYAEETGHDKDEILDLMAKETWFTGTEAVAFGLADALEEGEQTDEQNPDEDDDDNQERQEKGAGAEYSRYALVEAMYRPPANIREILSARTDAGGVAGTAASKQHRMKTNTDTPVAAANAPTSPMEAHFRAQRTASVTAKITQLAQGRVKNDKLQWWIDQAVAAPTPEAEQVFYDQLEDLPVAARPGGSPLPGDATVVAALDGVNLSRPLAAHDLRWGEEAPRPRTAFGLRQRQLPHAQRVQVHRREWSPHFNYCINADLKAGVNPSLPVAANTYSSTLITDFLLDEAVTVLQNRWAALECLTRDFSTDRYKPLATGQVKLVAAGATTLVATKGNPISSFETGDSTVNNVAVPLNHYSQPFHVTQDELMSGLRLENLVGINLAVLANTIISNCMQCLVTGGYNTSGSLVAFSAGTCNASAGTWSWNTNPGMPKLWGYLKKSPIKNAILDGVFMANLVNQPGFYQPTFNGERASDRAKVFGWDNIQSNTVWPSSLTNIGGIALNPQAIVAVAGLPQVPPTIPGATLQESVMTIPGPDISIASYLWFSLASRTLWNSFDVVFGSSGGDASAAALLFNQFGSVS